MYRLAIKESALESNPAVEELADESGSTIELDSKRTAEQLAERISAGGERVRVQRAAPNDPSDADGYLIRWPNRHVAEPKDSDVEGLTFDVGANQYGEIGTALVCGSYGLSPGVKYYLFDEFEHLSEDRHKLSRECEPHFPQGYDPNISWSPDCLIQVYSRATWDVEEMYVCEVKAGEASFQRNQAEDMQTVAEEFGVLKIRVVLDRLPQEYSVRIDQVQPE